MLLLSVIIPVFNVEAFLPRCIDSVLKQDLHNYEIILVDDGSEDSSGVICDTYAQLNENIRVIHKKNGGLSDARNVGLKTAKGEYVVFLDSDDWWNSQVNVNSLLSSVMMDTDIDFFLFDGLDYIENQGLFRRTDSISSISDSELDAISYYKIMLAIGNLHVSAATKVLKRSFLTNNSLFFTENLLGEDNEWMIRVLRSFPRIGILHEPLYVCQLRRANSITSSIKAKSVYDLLLIVKSSIDYYTDSNTKNELKEYELCFCSYLWFCALGLCNRLSRMERNQLHPFFENTADVCLYSNSPKTQLAYRVYRLL